MKKLLVFVLIMLLILAISCNKQENNIEKNNSVVKSGTLKGITLTPKSFQSADFLDFFEKAKSFSIISWSGDWNELSTEKGGPKVITELSKQYHYTPLVELQFFTQSTKKLIRPLDEKTKNDYTQSVLSFVSKYKPRYLALGLEVNLLDKKDLDDYILFYNGLYSKIKEVSPDTKVFTIFQLEMLDDISLIDKFKTDIIAFTTYPSLKFKLPSDIPSDYYTRLKFDKPIAFTEIGWPSDGQSEFVSRFFELTKDIKLEFIVWSFMYDQDTIKPFDSMGLISKDNKEKEAWNIWVNT